MTNQAPRILPDLQAEAAAEIARLRAEIEALRSASQSKLTLKVSEKGALSIYGLGRFPTTLYMTQFDRLNAAWPDVQAFVKANRSRFTTKE